jgi:integrase
VSVVDDLESASGKATADRARIALSSLFAWAIDRGYLDSNPTLNVRSRAQGVARARVLDEAELVEVWKACEDAGEFGPIVRLLILTGQRRGEIGDLAWPEIDIEKRQIELPERRTKNGRPHVIPLSAAALAIIDGLPRSLGRDLIFGRGAGGYGGWAKSKAELDARIARARAQSAHKPKCKPMSPWVLHDLRRSFVTHVSERGFAQPHVVEAIVNHISGAKAGIAGTYNKAVYAAEKRQALEMWGAHITALVAGKESNVVAMRA